MRTVSPARACLRAACLLAASLLPAARPAAADPTPAAAFLHALHALGAPADTPALLPAALEDPEAFRGQVFEVAVAVSGTMTMDGQVTALLSGGPSGTVTVRVPAALAATPWLSDSGSRVRVLLQVDRPEGDPPLSLIAAAPEADVDAVEQVEADRVRQAQMDRARAASFRDGRDARLASRAMDFPRTAPSALLMTPADGPATDTLSPDALRVLPVYRDAIHRLNTRLPDGLLNTITANILGFSERYGVDPRLVIAMMIAESGFDIYSTSPTGAMGLGQLMPETARGLGVTDAYDPAQNIEASVRLLRGHLEQYGGQISLTMAAYNAGPGAVRKYHGVPPYRETQHYVAKVAALYRQLCGG